MSNPVSNTEIEDVLSSIRRLVNEETRNIVAASQPEREKKPAKLVLTQSLRVKDAPVDEDPDQDLAPRTAEAPEPAAEADDSHGAEFTSQRTAPVEHAEPVAEQEPDDPAFAAGMAPDHQSELDEAHGDDFIFIREAKLRLRADQRADEAGDSPEAEEAADTAEDPDPAPWKDPEATLYAAARGEEEETEAAASPDLDAVKSAPLGSKIQAFEAAIGQTDDQWEPDGDVGDDYAGTQVETIQWEDHEEDHERDDAGQWHDPEQPPELEAEFTAEPEQDVAHDAAADPDPVEDETDEDALDVLSSEESFLDEESLRELVADIVRQELQGALGERITRNVRKLVRREIHRALVAQDLE